MLLNFTSTGQGSPVVLLHGIAGSSRYWQDVAALLVQNHRVISIDLLGFGRSPYPHADYSYETHISSINQTLKKLNLSEPFVLVGHSMGALLALRLATNHPKLLKKIILLNMPLYSDLEEAKSDITQGKKRLRYTFYGPSSHLLCTVWCRALRPLTKHVAPLYLPQFPRHVAQDSLLHSWEAFSKSLRNIIEEQNAEADLLDITVPALLLYGEQESSVVLGNAKKLKIALKEKDNINISIVKGPHHLPLSESEKIAKTIIAPHDH